MVTQLKQTSNMVSENKNNQNSVDSYIEIFDSLKQGIFVFGENNLLKTVNSTGYDILKSSLPDLSSQKSLENAPLEEVFRDTAFEGWSEQIKLVHNEIKDTFHRNMMAISGDSQRIYNVRALITDESPSSLIVTLDDITEQKASEQQFSELEKLAEKGVMASWVSHDLNNILGLILGSAELAELFIKKDKTKQVNEYLGKIKDNVSRMESFTSDLTNSTHLETDKCLTDLNKLATEVVSFVSGQKMFSRIVVSANVDSTLPKIEIDSGQIAQMLLHLMHNSADAIAKADCKSGHIEVCTHADGNSVFLSVTDNGTGMTSETKEKLFQRRFTTKEDNHGYSLMTCKNIMDNHSATVDIQSEVDKGSTFTVQLSSPDDK
ncbi:MAG: HAMP domain-containing sensor histidine kinase [candidate division Zixibacteria bacterium]|nr:HAMP domain-containing sensor histidine kinase [candidate division Zixibacteria bacterium]